jgi:hypothetical protein
VIYGANPMTLRANPVTLEANPVTLKAKTKTLRANFVPLTLMKKTKSFLGLCMRLCNLNLEGNQ